MRLLIIVLVTALSAVVCDDNDLKCIVGYLRANGINEDFLSSVEASSPDSSYCTLILNNVMSDMYQRMGWYSPENVAIANGKYVECIKRNTELSGANQLLQLIVALRKYEPGWKVWQFYSVEKRIKELAKTYDSSMIKINDNCNQELTKSNLADIFDSVIYKRLNYKGDEEYCLRKHLIEKGVLKAHAYNVNINPKGVNVNDVNCDQVLKPIIDRSYSNLKYSQCEEEKLRKNYLVEHYLNIEVVLPNIDLTPHEIATEKKDFIEYVYSIERDAIVFCKQKILVAN